MNRTRSILIWGVLLTLIIVPIVGSLLSPLLAWREPIYILAGLAGIIAMALLLVQPLLAAQYLPGLSVLSSQRLHRWIGVILVVTVIVHVGALWITSPPDVIDALTFNSPTPFSIWGVIAMWAVFAAAFMATLRGKLLLRLRIWRIGHTIFVTITVIGSVVHALMIEGTMETISKIALCGLVLVVMVKVLAGRKVWVSKKQRHAVK